MIELSHEVEAALAMLMSDDGRSRGSVVSALILAEANRRAPMYATRTEAGALTSRNPRPMHVRPRRGDAFVYMLIDPRDRAVRYIGATRDLTTRTQSHLKISGHDKTRRAGWQRELAAIGLTAQRVVVETVGDGDWNERERAWIAAGRTLGLDLLNVHAGGGPTAPLKKRLRDPAKCRACRKAAVEPGKTRCSACAEARRAADSARRAASRDEMLCSVCSTVAAFGRKYCERHLLYYRARGAEQAEAKRAARTGT